MAETESKVYKAAFAIDATKQPNKFYEFDSMGDLILFSYKVGEYYEEIKNKKPEPETEAEKVINGVWEPCSAIQCSNCNGIVSTEVNDLEHGEDEEDGEMRYECPHCGAWNTIW